VLGDLLRQASFDHLAGTITSGEKLEASIVDDGVGDADPSRGPG
jgi:hypothetical protein